MLWVSANHCDEGEAEQHNDQEEFSGGQPKLGLPIPFDREQINDASKVSWEVVNIIVELTHIAQYMLRRQQPAGCPRSRMSAPDLAR